MLPSSKRLRIKAFDEIIKKGQIFHSPFLILRVVVNQGPSQFAISIPKKVIKHAYLRNKIKRRIYTIIREHYSEIKDNIRAIIIAKKDIDSLSFEQLVKELNNVFVNSDLLK